jgi:hypothetical protein
MTQKNFKFSVFQPMIVSYNASAVKIYPATSSLVFSEKNNIVF